MTKGWPGPTQEVCPTRATRDELADLELAVTAPAPAVAAGDVTAKKAKIKEPTARPARTVRPARGERTRRHGRRAGMLASPRAFTA
jgi:hypothetical protein